MPRFRAPVDPGLEDGGAGYLFSHDPTDIRELFFDFPPPESCP